MSFQILETIAAEPGWECVYAQETGVEPLLLRPVASWAVLLGVPAAQGPEVCPMVQDTSGGLPRVTPIVQGLPSHCPANYLGLRSPGEDLAPWREKARAFLRDNAPDPI